MAVASDRMPEGVVNDLESVDVQVQNTDTLLFSPGASKCLLQAVIEKVSVWKIGQRIMVGQVKCSLSPLHDLPHEAETSSDTNVPGISCNDEAVENVLRFAIDKERTHLLKLHSDIHDERHCIHHGRDDTIRQKFSTKGLRHAFQELEPINQAHRQTVVVHDGYCIQRGIYRESLVGIRDRIARPQWVA